MSPSSTQQNRLHPVVALMAVVALLSALFVLAMTGATTARAQSLSAFFPQVRGKPRRAQRSRPTTRSQQKRQLTQRRYDRQAVKAQRPLQTEQARRARREAAAKKAEAERKAAAAKEKTATKAADTKAKTATNTQAQAAPKAKACVDDPDVYCPPQKPPTGAGFNPVPPPTPPPPSVVPPSGNSGNKVPVVTPPPGPQQPGNPSYSVKPGPAAGSGQSGQGAWLAPGPIIMVTPPKSGGGPTPTAVTPQTKTGVGPPPTSDPARQSPPRPSPGKGSAPAQPSRQSAPPSFVPGQLLVGFKSVRELESAVKELEQAQRSGGVSARGARSTSVQVDRLGNTAIRVSLDFRQGGTKLSGPAELEALRDYGKRLTRSSDAAFAHPNWILELEGRRVLHLEELSHGAQIQTTGGASSAVPTGLTSPGDSLLWHYLPPPMGMNALAAWGTVKGSRDIVVAVIDTGILPDHPAIKGSANVLAGYTFITDPERKGSQTKGPEPSATDNGDSCSQVEGSTWHGTHVSGTIGAGRANNEVGVTGVNWAVSVLPIRAMGRCWGQGTTADLASAVSWAAGLPVPGVPQNDHKADVINISVGLQKACETAEVGLLKQALDAARKAGVIVVAAAGNKRTDAAPIDVKGVSPAGCPGVISVAASNHQGHLTSYSNYGNVSVMAPGGDLGDARPHGVWSFIAPTAEFTSGVAAQEGTSMAAPHVSAAIALALSAKPELRRKPDEITKLLNRSLAPLPAGACSKSCGPGLLDAKAMVEPQTVTSAVPRQR